MAVGKRVLLLVLSIVMLLSHVVVADNECGPGWYEPPDCDICPPQFDQWDCETCNTGGGYYGLAPNCEPCWRSPGQAGDYCETNDMNTRGFVAGGDSCATGTCLCRNKFTGSRCETCPSTVKKTSSTGSVCDECIDDYGNYKAPGADSVSICSPLCKRAQCNGNGNPPTASTYASGCTPCTCDNKYNTATNCSTCLDGYTLASGCTLCSPGYINPAPGDPTCVKNCTLATDCSAGAIGVTGNYKIGCTCACGGHWYGSRCEMCPALMAPACDVCIAGFESAPNCTRTCTKSDCMDRASEVTGNYRVGCACTCRNAWTGPVVNGVTKNCTTCPVNFNVSTDCDLCNAGYQNVGGQCKESCTEAADCSNHAILVSGIKGNCTCRCRNQWDLPNCSFCPARYTGDCDACGANFIEYPTCYRNCTSAKDCNYHATSVEGFTNNTCKCHCRNGWTGNACETCPPRFDSSEMGDCAVCNGTTHEGIGMACFPKCTVARNCSNHATNVTGNDNTTCSCDCENKWTGYTCATCPIQFDQTINCGACSSKYEDYPNCYLKCTNADNCTGHATDVSGNVVAGCSCICDPTTKWYGPKCASCPINYDQTTCKACSANYTKYPDCFLKCSNANCSNNANYWEGDTSVGCNCTCKDKWQGPACSVCPSPGGNLADNCRTCNPGYGGPLCLRICTAEVDCNSHASLVSGFEGNCTCKCAHNWFGASCDKCPVRYESLNNCTGCSAGYVEAPHCYLNCTLEANCSGHADWVTGNSNVGCTCQCRNQWGGSGGNCSQCAVNYSPLPADDCGTCAPTYNFYPACVRDCTNYQDCNDRATTVSGAFPNCTCACTHRWGGPDCGTCPPAYDPAQNCAACAPGYRGTYPECNFICTSVANCSSHAVAVSGDTTTGCECECAHKWLGDNCSVCPTRYDPATNCSACAANYEDFPTCHYVCNDALDCSSHSLNVSGINWNCACNCRNNWTGSDCSQCPIAYNASLDCGECSRGYDSYPGCFLTCTIPNNCSDHATLVSGNTDVGCNCTCRFGWYGPSCSQCPPLYDPAKDCNECIPGWSGFPNCRELCTNSSDCSDRATEVTGYKGNCTCECRNSYSGSRCEMCPPRFDLSADCAACAAGFDSYPTCALTCTVERDCADKAVNVTGNNITGCVCDCRNMWDSANCTYCASNWESRADCGTCASGYDDYPRCARICTNWDDCSGHASSVTGLYPNCKCNCSAQWGSDDCSVCPQQYDSQDCASCAVGFTGAYPVCSFICTIAANCTSHATQVTGTALTGCNCTCRSKWFGDDCAQCEARYDPVKDCSACSYGFEEYPLCRTACMVDRDCNQRASNVTGIYPNCTCGCRNKWYGDSCEYCPSKYNATADCSACTADRDDYPACYRRCDFTDCSNNAVEVLGNEHTGCVCKCRNAYGGDRCDVCPPTVNASQDCSVCSQGYGGYPLCGPICTPIDCTNRSTTVSGGRPYCNCTCRNGWSGSDCSVCPIEYIASTDCFDCSPGHTKVNGKCYRYCNVSLDCHGRGMSVTGNLGIGCTCKCRNNYTAPVCADCPAGYNNVTADCTGCAEGWGGFPNCKPLCSNESDCSGRATAVHGVIGECYCVCRNGWWGRRCEICPAQYNLFDDCGTCNKYRRQDYPNCSRLSRSMPTQTFSIVMHTLSYVVATNSTTLSLPLPNTFTASSISRYLSRSSSLDHTHTTSTSWSSSISTTRTFTTTYSFAPTLSRTRPETRSRPIAPTRSQLVTATRSLPSCVLSQFCLHANRSYRVGYDCHCECYGNWVGKRCDQCPAQYSTHVDGSGVIQGCTGCAANYMSRNGTCLTSSHFYGSLDAGNASCAGHIVTSKSSLEGVGSRAAYLTRLSDDLRHLLLGVYAYFECPNAENMDRWGVFTATVFDMYATSTLVPARDVRYLFDAVLWNESKTVAVSMSECMSNGMYWLLSVWKNGGQIPTTPMTTIPTTADPRYTTTLPTRTARPTFAPVNAADRVFDAQDDPAPADDGRGGNHTSASNVSSDSDADQTIEGQTSDAVNLSTVSAVGTETTSGDAPSTSLAHVSTASVSTVTALHSGTTSAENATTADGVTAYVNISTLVTPTATQPLSSAGTTTPTMADTTVMPTSVVVPTSSATALPTTRAPTSTATGSPLYPLYFFDNDTLFETSMGSDYIYGFLDINGTGCLAFQGGAFSYGDYSRCGLIGCAPEDFTPTDPPAEDPFPWWWIVLGMIAAGLLILAIMLFRRYRLRRRIDEAVNPKDTHKYTLQFLLSEDEELRQIAQDREDEELDFFDDDDLL